MAISRHGLSSALCLAISLLIAPITAQTRPSFGIDPIRASSLILEPTPTTKPECITVTSTQYGPCATPLSCQPVACPAYVRLVTQPCGCPYPAETATVKAPCGCPGCPPNIWVEPAVDCPGKPCAVVTQTSHPTGCIGIDCIYLSTIALGCDCTGISTKTEYAKTCPSGCATQYIGLPAPCPSPTATVW